MRLHRAERDAGDIGEILVANALEVMPGDEELIMLRESGDRFLEPVLELQLGERRVVRDRFARRPSFLLDRKSVV